jgi:HEAT repeat protein
MLADGQAVDTQRMARTMNRLLIFVPGLLLALGATGAVADDSKTDKPAVSFAGRSLQAWQDDLDDRDPLVREEAVEVLAQLGAQAKETTPRLRKLLADPSRTLRARAALALWRVAGEVKPAVAVLTESLREPSPVTRRDSLSALAQMGPEAASASGAIVELLDDRDLSVRIQAGTTLTRLGRAALPSLVKALASKEVRVRRTAMGQIVGFMLPAVGKEYLPTLSARLEDEDPQVRIDAARVLWWFGQADKPVIAALTEGVRSPDSTVRNNVLNALAGSSERPAALVPLLEVALKSTDQNNRLQAARILFEVEKKPGRVLPIYLAVIKDSNRTWWSGAVTGLGELGPAAKSAVPRLVEMMKIRDYYNYEVRTTLVRIGPDAIAPLVALLKEPIAPGTNTYNSPQESAVSILGQLGGKAAEAVLPVLANNDATVRLRGVRVLAAIGPDAKDAVPKLIELLKGPSTPPVRDQALVALGNIGPDAKAAIDPLVDLAKGTDVAARTGSMRALMRMKPDAQVVVPIAEQALEDKTAVVRGTALELLHSVDPRHKDLLEKSREFLKEPATRVTALAVLGRMGSAAARAVPDVAKLLDDPSDNVRSQAVNALGQIGPAAKDTVPALLDQLRRTDSSLQSNVVVALKNIGADPRLTVPKLTDFIKSSRNWSVNNAVTLLGEYGPKGAEAAPALLLILRDASQNAFQRGNAGLALALVDPARAKKEGLADLKALMQVDASNMTVPRAILLADPGDSDALVAIENGLKSTYYYTRGNAAGAIGHLGERGKKFTPTLKKLLDDPQYWARGNAAVALWRITKDAGEALPTLKAMLQNRGHSYTRSYGALCLAELGAAAKPAWDALLALRGDPDPYVRAQVEAALKKIDPSAAVKAGVP